MTDEEQRKVFARNLSFQISLTGKSQKDIAKDLGINAPTLNMWVKGNSIPRVGTIQHLADYFHCTKSALVDEPMGYSSTPDGPNLLKLAFYSKVLSLSSLNKLVNYAEKLALEEHKDELEEGESIWEYVKSIID